MNRWISLPVLWNSFVSSITSIPEASSTHTEPAAHPHGEPYGRRVKFPTRPGLMMSYCKGEEEFSQGNGSGGVIPLKKK